MSKNLIIYYSRKGENSVNGRIVKLAKGNTEICAEYIQKAVGGGLFEVSTTEALERAWLCTERMRQDPGRLLLHGLRRMSERSKREDERGNDFNRGRSDRQGDCPDKGIWKEDHRW